MTTNELSTQPESNAVRYLAPPVEVSETEKSICLTADMPGVGPNGATVEIHDDILVLEGAVERTHGKSPKHYRRRFTLTDPALFDLEHITARMSHGVVEVEIPKAAKPEPRQIKITAA
jgi:HSP20 family protein